MTLTTLSPMSPRSVTTLIAAMGALALTACEKEPEQTPTETTETGTPTTTTTGSTTEPTEPTEPTTPPEPTVDEWLLDVGHFSYVHGSYGKPTYCGAFEVGAIAGYPDVRCTDNTAYLFSDNGDGTIRMEEAYYVHKISSQNPDGSTPWFVDAGYAGSIVWQMTPLAPLSEADDTEAMEFEMQMVSGNGPDGWFEYLGASGMKQKMIFARGGDDDVLIDWLSAEWNDETSAWDELGHAFQDWAIHVYPFGGGDPAPGVVGAFLSQPCPSGSVIDGAVISDGNGGTLPAGPGYCAPECRMETPNALDGANDLPVCAGAFVAEEPRATGL